MNLKHLTDKSLLLDTKSLAQQYRNVTTKLLHHLKEIERRKLFSSLGYQSLFEYAVKELGFSEGSASRRINAARLLEDNPEIEQRIQDGSLTLMNLSIASQTIKGLDNPEEKKAVLQKIENLSSRNCEKTILALGGNKPTPKPVVKVVSPELTTLRLVLSDDTFKAHEELKTILASAKLPHDEFYKRIFKAAKDYFVMKRHNVGKERLSSNLRYVTPRMKKEVYARDKGKCTRCGSIKDLQYDHIIPYALGGKTEPTNLRLLCKNCNQRAAIEHRLSLLGN